MPPAHANKFARHPQTPARPRAIRPEEYRLKVLGLPGPIDRWLSANARMEQAWTNIVFLEGFPEWEDVRRNRVFCTVKRERVKPVDDPDSIFTESDTYRLYLTGTICDSLLVETPLRTSPRAVLDHYVGSSDDLSAPEWTRWNDDILEFCQPRDTFIALFARMALWKHNLNEIGLSSRMFHWATGISVGTWAEHKQLAPTTPRKSTRHQNARRRKGARGAERAARFHFEELEMTPTRLGPHAMTGDITYLAHFQDICSTIRPGQERLAGTCLAPVDLLGRSLGALTSSRALLRERTAWLTTSLPSLFRPPVLLFHATAPLATRSSRPPPPNGQRPKPVTLATRHVSSSSSTAQRTLHSSQLSSSQPSLSNASSPNTGSCNASSLTQPTTLQGTSSSGPRAGGQLHSFSPPPENFGDEDVTGHIPDSQDMRIHEAEQRGLRHVQEVIASGFIPDPISRDDWEEDDDDDEFGDTSNRLPHNGGIPSMLPQPSQDVDTQSDLRSSSGSASEPSATSEEPPDPFYYTPEPSTAFPTPKDVHPNRVVYIIYLLVLWLHTQCHLPFRACNATLVCFGLVLRAAGAPVSPPMATTLPTVISALRAEPSFQVNPVCPRCMRVYPASISPDSKCSSCESPLFANKTTPAQQRSGRGAPEKPRPLVQFPNKSLAEQLAIMLATPGIEDVVEGSVNNIKKSVPGTYTNIFDGKVCQELPCADGSLFFSPSPEQIQAGELRIGVSLGVDWSVFISAKSNSTLPHLGAYVVQCDQLASSSTVSDSQSPTSWDNASELLRLWKEGVVIVTPKYPQGRLVRVALVAVVCDKPAAHKLGGFGSHSHTYFCTMCWVTQELKATTASFTDGFPARTNEEQRRLQTEYLKCNTKTAQAEFIKKYSTRWSELHRLPYFDVCRMIVIDPMHNLFLGIVKTHFYHIWVQLNILRKTKELRRLHAILADLHMPAKLGRLPSLIGEPAGGSLTADQWLVFATVVAPFAIPQIWQDYLPNGPRSTLEHRTATVAITIAEKQAAAKARRQARAKEARGTAAASTTSARPQRDRTRTARAMAMDVDPDHDNGIDDGAISNDSDDPEHEERPRARRTRKRKNADTTAEDEAIDNATPSNLHEDDPGNFLKLCTALKILVSRTITEHDLTNADRLLREYCLELVKLYGPAVIRPNHHYAVHTPASVRDYGPLHEFWTFLFERLNKVLKSYKTSNHAGGELETSFFREFHRTVQESRLLAQAAQDPADLELSQAAAAMYKASADDRGTVQALSRELDEAQEDEGITFKLSQRAENASMPSNLYYLVLRHFVARLPDVPLHSHISLPSNPLSKPFYPQATFFDHVIINHQRFTSSRRSGASADALIAVQVGDTPVPRLWIGELQDIFLVNQESVGMHRFGRVRWFRPAEIDVNGTVWQQFSSSGMQFWAAEEFLEESEAGPEPLIDLQQIFCHVIRQTVVVNQQNVWVTALLDRNGTRS
ncbi:hypothetical protein FPV67DRAFT_1677229 [Lyophyllum atratum]|nr:hypothetical protein FPV67DRAFT_1677229 [Lyophyllum atratum]